MSPYRESGSSLLWCEYKLDRMNVKEQSCRPTVRVGVSRKEPKVPVSAACEGGRVLL